MIGGCDRSDPNRVQGYVEGEFVYIASPRAGQLEKLDVQRGQQVKAGDELFTLESTPETAARDEAKRRVGEAEANLDDIKKGKRPSEIQSIQSQLDMAQAALTLAETEFARQDKLYPRSTSQQDYDRARSARDQGEQHVSELQADLETAKLGARPDQIAAAEANVRALESALAMAEWNLSQKRQTAPQAGLIFDTLYREGEWVTAGKPVISLLPPAQYQSSRVRARAAGSGRFIRAIPCAFLWTG